MEIQNKLLTINQYSRPYQPLISVKGIVIHWTANPMTTAKNNRDFFELRKDGKHGYGSAHYIIGLKGEVVKCIPDYEVAYHIGSTAYKEGITEKLSSYPNNCTIGIECCHLDWEGTLTEDTYNSLVHLTRNLMKFYNLTPNNIYRHYDIGNQQYEFRGNTYIGKPCPYFFVKDEENWVQFLKKLNG